jgi:hypothetical protein
MRKIYTICLAGLFMSAIVFSSLTSCVQKSNSEIEVGEEDEDYDGIDQAIRFEIERTKDPSTGKVPWQKLRIAMEQTEVSKLRAGRTQNTMALAWEERGPNGDFSRINGNGRPNDDQTSGRIRATMVDSLDPTHRTVFVGSVAGGLWKTTDITAFPATWTLVNDFLSNLAISDICQDPRPGFQNIMYLNTGESYQNSDAVRGVGVFKSIDAGTTWTFLSSTSGFLNGTRILCDHLGNVYAGFRGNGLQRSTDGGTTWTNITPSGIGGDVCDLEISTTAVAGRLHVTTGIFSTSGYRYTDNPSTATSGSGWTASTTAFTTFNQRTELAISGNNLYACPDNSAHQVPTIWRSTDGGDNWAGVPVQPNGGTWANGQGWYDISCGINPSNPLECIVGGLECYKTTNGGSSWTKIAVWVGGGGQQYIHADQHDIQWWDGGAKLMFACDGGIHYSADGGTTIRDRNKGLRIKQFYSVAIHPTDVNNFIAGAQDNGMHRLNHPGLDSSIEFYGGDGMYAAIDQDEPQFQFGAAFNNNIRRTVNGGVSWGNVAFAGGRFVSPWDYDNAGNVMYLCNAAGSYLRWNNPQGGAVSSNIVTVAEFSGGNVSAVHVSPYTSNRVFFGTGSAGVIRVDNANVGTSATGTIITPAGASGYVNCVVTGSSDQTLMACYSNYGVNNVWLSTNGGSSWTACDGNLPDMPVRWALFHPDDNTRCYIATETGVWETDLLDGASTVWTANTSFPNVSTHMIKYRASDRTIAAGTHGRGIWTAIVPPVSCTPPAIATQPSNQVVCAGANATFTVSASGAPPFTYQWQESINGGGNWNNITNGGIYSGATSVTLTLTGVTTGMNSYQYRVIVSNCDPATATSNGAVLTVNALPAITSHPSNQTICAGANTSFSVTATGAGITYQWQVNSGAGFTNISNGGVYSNATTQTLNITGALASMNGYQYRVVVTGTCNPAATSNSALLTVNAATSITTQPSNANICAGNNASFTVVAGGGGLTYQWQENSGSGFANITNGGVYSGATTATLLLTGVTVSMNSYQYRVVINGSCPPANVTSNAVVLTVGTALVITTQPANQVVCAGQTANFSVGVTGTVLNYQWQENTGSGFVNITNGGIYSGATSATLTITGVTAGMNNYQYRVVLTGSCPPINSSAALLTVNTAAAISSQPVNVDICRGSSTTLCVTATGTNITYVWEFSGSCAGPTWIPVPAGTTNCITVTPLVTTAYRVRIVSPVCGSEITSSCATVTVNVPVNITSQPSNSAICEGANTSFSVTATGTIPIYQWQVNTGSGFTNLTNGGVYSNVNQATLNITGATFSMNGYQYRVIVFGATPCASSTSNPVTLTVNQLAAITTQPSNAVICLGGSNNFCVTAIGTNLTYAWETAPTCAGPFTNIVGAASNCYISSSSTNAVYRVVITSTTCGNTVTSNCVTLTVNTPIAITTQPNSVAICSGDNANFSVAATGTSPTIQWQVNTGSGFTNVTNGGVYSGAATTTLNITGGSNSMSGNIYRAVVSGAAPCGAVNSANATLTVRALPTVGLTGNPALTTILPGQIVTLTATPLGSGGTVTTTWYKNGIAFVNGTNTFNVNVEKIGAYQVKIQEAWPPAPNAVVCSNESPIVTIGTTGSNNLFIFPSPNDGQFTVSYFNSSGGSTSRTILVYDSKGAKVYSAKFQVSGPYTLLDVDIRPALTGIYYVVVGDANEKKLAEGKVLVH